LAPLSCLLVLRWLLGRASEQPELGFLWFHGRSLIFDDKDATSDWCVLLQGGLLPGR
jgi:hypothetical protein